MQVKTVQYGAGERGRPQPRARRTGVRAGDADRRGTRQATASDFGGDIRAHPLDDDYHRARSPVWDEDRRRRCSPPPTGAARACIRAAISKASCAPRRSRNGWRCTASSTGPISTPTTAASCSSSSSTISCTARTPAGTSSRRCCCKSAIRARTSSRAPRTNGRSSAPSGPNSISIRPTMALHDHEARAASAKLSFDAMGDGVTFLTPPLEQPRPRSPARRRSSCSCRRRPATPTSSSCCGCSPAT